MIRIAFLAATLLAGAASAQGPDPFIPPNHPLYGIPLFRYTLPLHYARSLPVAGPEAAPVNPARLLDAPHWFSQIGTSGGGRVSVTQTSLGIAYPGRAAIGMTLFALNGSATGTNAVFHEQRGALQAAAGMPLGTKGGRIAIGYAYVERMVDAWNIYRASASTHDLGLVWQAAPMANGWKTDLGLALKDLDPIDGDIPDTLGLAHRYRLYRPNADLALRLVTPTGSGAAWITFVAESRKATYDKYGPVLHPGPGIGGPGFDASIHRYGGSFRLWRALTLRLENLGFDVWQTGATLDAGRWLPWRLEADAALSRGYYFAYARPLESGWTGAWTLRGGW